jgi:hypothetical protein
VAYHSWRAAGALLPVIAVVLGACAIVDQYSERAVGYNLEAEQALDQGLLLNVIRASQRRPMQFTSVQTISGTASISGNAGATIPFGPGFGSALKTGTFSSTLSGGPTFTVPVLDTQEFYSGVMGPISGQLFDFFIHEEYPREELFTLFVEKIVIHKDACEPFNHMVDCELVFVNYPGNDIQFDLTQAMIEHLLNLGLTTERISSQSGAKSAPMAGLASPSTTASSTTTPASSQQGQTQAPEYRFCFAPRHKREHDQIVDDSARCGFENPKKPSGQNVTTTITTHVPETKEVVVTYGDDSAGARAPAPPLPRLRAPAAPGPDSMAPAPPEPIAKESKVPRFKLPDWFIDDLMRIANGHRDLVGNLAAFKARNRMPTKVSVTIYTRSTEGILYFLGEIVRHQLYPDQIQEPGQQPRIYQIKIETASYRRYPEAACDPTYRLPGQDIAFTCQNLFVLDKSPALSGTALPSVAYNGQRYWVPSDGKEGKTLHVLSIVKQLLALSTSAKSLPQTNVISVISP